MAGFDNVSGHLQAVAIGGSNLAATFLAMSPIDRLGRKSLLLIGSVGMVICLSGVAGIFLRHTHQNLLIVRLVGFVGFFALSQGAVIWVYLSEIFPNRVRAKGQSLESSTHWLMNALISGVFSLLATRSQAYPFVFFASMMVLQFFVVLFQFPETKGVTLAQMQQRRELDQVDSRLRLFEGMETGKEQTPDAPSRQFLVRTWLYRLVSAALFLKERMVLTNVGVEFPLRLALATLRHDGSGPETCLTVVVIAYRIRHLFHFPQFPDRCHGIPLG
jgi:MFS family permease